MAVIAQAEDLECLQHSNFGGVPVGFDGAGDKISNIVPKAAVASINGQLDDIGRWLGNLVYHAVDESNAGGFFWVHRQEFGDGNLKCVGDILNLGDGRIALHAGEQVAGAGTHPVGDVSQGEALFAADCFEVSFYRIHSIVIMLRQRYGFVDILTNKICDLLVK